MLGDVGLRGRGDEEVRRFVDVSALERRAGALSQVVEIVEHALSLDRAAARQRRAGGSRVLQGRALGRPASVAGAPDFRGFEVDSALVEQFQPRHTTWKNADP